MVSNYMYDTFTYGGYSVNVEHPDSWEKITITPIRTKLNRTIRPPLFEPGTMEMVMKHTGKYPYL